MFSLKKMLTCCLAAAVLVGGASLYAEDQAPPEATPVPAARKPLIQIAILLDTSNSMDGLINQAKSHLWRIVNEFATAKQNGQRPELQVALYEYGNNGLSPQENFIRQVLPLTTDLDKVSEQLFALKTNGGEEYCGAVIRHAIQTLTWSQSDKDFKAIFIAGNEPFTQGPVDYTSSCKEAISKGVIVNTIHCGPYAVGVQTKWQDGALLADGSYTNIDQNKTAVAVVAPQDKELAELNAKLNGTYVAYGEFGRPGQARQVAQDAASSSLGGANLSQRAAAKSSALYSNARWDLVDAIQQKKVKLEDLKDEDLPENMRKMSLAERKAFVEQQSKLRADVQAKIQSLADARDKYVTEAMRKQAQAAAPTATAAPAQAGGVGKPGAAPAATAPAGPAGQSLDDAIVKTVREQAARKSFEFKDKK
jgi:von Willebrand factor type A domain